MFFLDFCKTLFWKNEVGVLIWLVLNVVLVSMLTPMMLEEFLPGNFAVHVLIGLVLYAVCLFITMTSFGEWIFRKLQGWNWCVPIARWDHLEKLEPIFDEIYSQAVKLDCFLPAKEDIRLFLCKDAGLGAFAIGRSSICITEELLEAEPRYIKAALSHELAHISSNDTDLLLLITVGNFFVMGLFLAIRIFLLITGVFVSFMGGIDVPGAAVVAIVMKGLVNLLAMVGIGILMRLWTQLGIALVIKFTLKAKEFQADEFTFSLGYGNDLCELLDMPQPVQVKGAVFTALNGGDIHARIATLMELGVTYRKPGFCTKS